MASIPPMRPSAPARAGAPGAEASLVLGFPNSRFRDGEVVYGARVRNLSQPGLPLLVKDLSFYRRYLHQHGFRTYLQGKDDLLLTATRGEP